MKRKLFSAMLSIFALLLLMGAAAVPEQPAALLAEEEITVYQFHVDLHKNKKSYIIKDIVFEKQIDT